MNIKLIIFDFDGTIMDTKKTIVVSKQETLRQMGLDVAEEQACADTIGMSAKIGFQKLCPELSDDMIDLCMKKYREIFDETKKTIPPLLFPNMIETLNRLNEKGIVCTIATSRGRDSLLGFLESMNIAKYFSYLLAAEDTTLHKPNAEPVKKTLNELSYNAQDTLVVVDMPFMSYQTSVYDAVVNAGRLMKEGRANAVKLEGGVSVCPQIKAITDAGIPVMAHLGLTPQSINAFGGFKVQGKNEAAARKLIDDAKAVEKAGAFALVLECVPAKLAKIISEQLTIPTIGIGAGSGCDGQILVYQDMLGMFSDYTPKFVKRFAEVGSVMQEAFANYIKEVQAETYPAEEHTFKIDDEVLEKLY